MPKPAGTSSSVRARDTATHETRARTDRQPGRLAEAAGARYDEFSNFLADVPVAAPDNGLPLQGEPAAARWLECLVADDATVLARYQHPHFEQWAAVTTRDTGRGRITCVGILPNLDLARAIMRWVGASRERPWGSVPESMTSTGATAHDGRRLRFLHNWSFTPTQVRVPVAARNAIDKTRYVAGDTLRLAPWDVHVLVED